MNDELFTKVLIQLEPELAQELGKELISIRTKLKALEIIKKNTTKDGINIDFKKILKWNGDYDEETIKEFNLLKEVLL